MRTVGRSTTSQCNILDKSSKILRDRPGDSRAWRESHACSLWTECPTVLLRAHLPTWTVDVDMDELPKQWCDMAEQAGPRPTFQGIADAAGISHLTLRRLVADGRSTPKAISKVADALRIPVEVIYKMAPIEVSDWGPWVPPMEAHRLEPRTREALHELIRAITSQGAQVGRRPTPQKTPRGPTAPTQLTPSRRPLPEVQERAARTIDDKNADGEAQE